MSDKKEVYEILRLFFDVEPREFEIIDTSHGETDFREVIIAELETGEKAVVKLADNDFTFPDKIRMWQRTVEEYLAMGYYCPRIMPDKTGEFPTVTYKGHKCVAYAEEYALYRPAEYYPSNGIENIPPEKYEAEAWIMTARIAAKYFSYTDYPSGYCMFETFCPSDKTDEVLEMAEEWRAYAVTLPEEFKPQTERIWTLWLESRAALEKIYKKLPTSVFQADLNPTNILVDENGNFKGMYDFNLCGREVFLNYFFREAFHKDIDWILKTLSLVSRYYSFSELEKQAAPMLYRCIKPLWFSCDHRLEKLNGDKNAIKSLLDETEYCLTADIDFSGNMG